MYYKNALSNESDDLISAFRVSWPADSPEALKVTQSNYVCLLQVFRVVSICLGCPPETVCWEYRDKDKNFHRLGPLTPLEFYREHVKPLYNVEDKVCYPLHVYYGPLNWILPVQILITPLLHSIPKILLFPQVCLVNDPRPQNQYGKLYTVEFLGNMIGARCTLYNNQPIQLLKKAAAESIKQGEVGSGPRAQRRTGSPALVC